jgi:hypothetical protein
VRGVLHDTRDRARRRLDQIDHAVNRTCIQCRFAPCAQNQRYCCRPVRRGCSLRAVSGAPMRYSSVATLLDTISQKFLRGWRPSLRQ